MVAEGLIAEAKTTTQINFVQAQVAGAALQAASLVSSGSSTLFLLASLDKMLSYITGYYSGTFTY